MAEIPLPDEIVGLILNGLCEKNGCPLLDPRYRSLARSVCRQWHHCIVNPSPTDAARMRAQAPPALADAWVHGRLVRMTVLVDNLLAGRDLSNAWSDCMPGGAEAVEALAGMIVGDEIQVVDAFLRWASHLSGSLASCDWSPPLRLNDNGSGQSAPPMPCASVTDSVAVDAHDRERHARRCLARIACCLGHTGVVRALFDRYNLLHASVVFSCVGDAAKRDHVDTVEVLLVAIADHASDTEETLRASGERQRGHEADLLLFTVQRALYGAACSGSAGVLYALLGKVSDDDDGSGSGRNNGPWVYGASNRHAPWIRSVASGLQKTSVPWEILAATHCPDVTIFERSRLPYDHENVGAAAIAAGRTDVIDWLAASEHADIVRRPNALLALLQRIRSLTMPNDGGAALPGRDAIDARDSAPLERGVAHAIDTMGLGEPTPAQALALFRDASRTGHHYTALAACAIKRWLGPAWDGLDDRDRKWTRAFVKSYFDHGRWSSIEHIVGGGAVPFCNLWDMVRDTVVCAVYTDVITMDKAPYCFGHGTRAVLWLACLCGAVPRSPESDALCRDMDVPTESPVPTEVWKSWCVPSPMATSVRQGMRPPIHPTILADRVSTHRSQMDRMALLFSKVGLI